SGFEAIRAPGGEYVLRALSGTGGAQAGAGAADVTALAGITVSGAAEGTAPNTNYTVRRTSSATGLDLAPKDTPQSMTTFTAQQIQDQGLLTVGEVLDQTPGVTLVTAGVGGAGSQPVYSRTLPVKAITMDGMMATTYLMSGMVEGQIGMQDSFLYERIDIIRGSTSLTGGSGDPSASLNFVRKHPYYDRHLQANFKYGSWNTKRAELDFSTPFTEDGRWRGRVAAAWQKGDHWVDRVDSERKALSLITALDVTDKDTLSVGMTYYDFELNGASPHGVARYSTVRIPRNYPDSEWPEAFPKDPAVTGNYGYVYEEGEAGRNFNSATPWSRARRTYKNLFASWEHLFNDDWSIKLNYNYAHNKDDSLYGEIGTRFYVPSVGRASYSADRRFSENKVHALDLRLNGAIEVLGREQSFLVGANYYDTERLNYTGWPTGGVGGDQLAYGCWYPRAASPGGMSFSETINFRCNMAGAFYGPGGISIEDWNSSGGNIAPPVQNSPIGYGAIDIFSAPIAWLQKKKIKGAYFAVHLRPLDRVSVIVGGRWAEETRKNSVQKCFYENPGPSCGQEATGARWNPKEKPGFLPYYGLIVKLTKDINVYASHTTSYEIQNRQKQYSQEWQPPYKWVTQEVGVKGGFFNDRLNVAAAWFKSTQKNYAWYIPGTRIEGLGDGYIVRGYELSIAGQITPRWMISGGYVRQTQQIPLGDGSPKTSMLDRMDFTADYRAPKQTFKLFTSYAFDNGLMLGGGVRWQSAVESDWYPPSGLMQHYRKLRHDAYAVVDAMARYRVNKNFSVQLNVNNLFDKEYYQHEKSYISGAPRNVLLTAGYRF
ncbi:TonB-dependent siderophore receptor, partial [Paracandidimonas soli]|uniref:TonB-dependent siderophore receptor n=1 Tax=Paracandidimonas soli TaxID=1917182 RepID=UPI00334046FC